MSGNNERVEDITPNRPRKDSTSTFRSRISESLKRNSTLLNRSKSSGDDRMNANLPPSGSIYSSTNNENGIDAMQDGQQQQQQQEKKLPSAPAGRASTSYYSRSGNEQDFKRTSSILSKRNRHSRKPSDVQSINTAKIQQNNKNEKDIPALPKSHQPPNIENPLRTVLSKIFEFFFASILIAILFTKYLHWSIALLSTFILAYVLRIQLQIAADDSEWSKEEKARLAQQESDEKNSESVEWMNAVLKTVWPLINQDYFVPFIDLMEDALMQQVPGIVHGCRVEDLDQGTVPLHIQSFTLLDPSDRAFIEGASASEVHEMDDLMENNEEVMKHAEDSSKGDIPLDVGEFVNLELTFAYRSPAARQKGRKSNKADGVLSDGEREAQAQFYSSSSDMPIDQIHMLIYMAIGLQKIAAIEVPVWCEVLGIEGKMRLRMQLVPTAPFIAHVAFTFVGKPKLEISAKPLGRRMVIDAMHLPIISTYVLHSVEAVLKHFVSPHSYTVDIASLLEAQDGPRNVYALGVIVLLIHQATDLAAADANGNSDPFVSVSFARATKPLFTTRVLLKTRDPIWHELAILPVSADEVRDQERLRMTVFDADRFSVDDPLGKVEVSVDKLINRALQHQNRRGEPSILEVQTEDLKPMRRGSKVQGRLGYSVGFFRLSKPSYGRRSETKSNLLRQAAGRHEETPVTDASFDAGQNKSLPVLPETPSTPPDSSKEQQQSHISDLYKNYTTPFDRFVSSLGFPLDEQVLEHRKERKERVKKLTTMMEGEAQATFGPPDKEWKSGILAFHIHSIEGLGFENPQKSWTNSKRLSQKPQYAADEDPLGEGTSKMPNSYIQVFLNDEAIYRTRTKTFNPQPFFNAGSERFVSDFEKSRIDFVVRDSRLREGDPILGVAGIRLDDTIVSSCRVTQWYTLTGGLGYGKVRITLLWRSVELKIPPPLSGWNVGVVEIGSCFAGNITASHKAITERREAHILFETVGGKAETESVAAKVKDNDQIENGALESLSYKWTLNSPVRIAVRQRYPNFIYLHLRSDSRIPGKSHRIAHAVIPLNRLEDNKEVRKRVPLYETSEWQSFEQDVLRDMTKEDQLADFSQSSKRRLPVLEEIVKDTTGEAEGKETKDEKGDIQLKKVGYLDIDLIFHSGLGPEHDGILAGDHGLRAAFECFQALVDCGERDKPKMLSSKRRKKLSLIRAGKATATGGGSGEEPETVEVSAHADIDKLHINTNVANERKSGKQNLIAEDDEGEFDSNGDEEEISQDGTVDDDADLVEGDTSEGRRARRRNLHRQQRGAAQIKSFRTLQWLKTNAEDGVVRVKKLAKKEQNKRVLKMESEGVSHF